MPCSMQKSSCKIKIKIAQIYSDYMPNGNHVWTTKMNINVSIHNVFLRITVIRNNNKKRNNAENEMGND